MSLKGVKDASLALSVTMETTERKLKSEAKLFEVRVSADLMPFDDEAESFSACLLVKDENHRLPEWLAYHYLTLPLRYLVVAVDPSSLTSPSSIFDRYRKLGLMKIVEWTDTDYMGKILRPPENATDNQKHNKHVMRQVQFYRACTRHLHQQNRTWTTYTDADEYYALSRAYFQNVTQLLASKPGIFLDLIKQYREEYTVNTSTHLLNTTEKRILDHFRNRPCITLPRATISAVESSLAHVQSDVPRFLNGSHFNTLRFRYHCGSSIDRGQGPGKSFLDASLVQPADFQGSFGSPHRPLRSICPSAFSRADRLPFLLYHYLGDWDSFSWRADSRNDEFRFARYRKESVMTDGGVRDDVRSWIRAFVDYVGEKKATVLLQGAGKLPSKSLFHALQ